MRNLKILSLISTAALIIAVFSSELPYSYFQLLRWLICLVSIWSALKGHQNWSIAFWILTLLFNPIAPIHFGREVWQVIDLVAAGILFSTIFPFINKESKK